MFLAHRTQQQLRKIGITFIVYLFVVGAAALLFPKEGGTYSESYFRWFIGISLGLFAWGALEHAGTTLVGFPFWERMSGVSRITLMVLIIVTVILAVMGTIHLLKVSNAL
jgi:hypothetical protein